MVMEDMHLVDTFHFDPQRQSECGGPVCCPGEQPRFQPDPFPTAAFQALELDLTLHVFEPSERVFRDTGVPCFPCVLTSLCIPCW